MPPKAVIFDLDETLIHYAPGPTLEESWLGALSALGIHVSDASSLSAALLRWRKHLWNDPERQRIHRVRMHEAFKLMLSNAATDCMLSIPDAIRGDAARIVLDQLIARCECYPDALPTLAALAGQGIRLAILTNGDPAMQSAKLKRCDLASRVEVVQIEGAAGVGKPDPKAFELILSTLNLPARDALMVGDNPEVDIAGARAAGLRAVRLHRSAADPTPETITTLSALLPMFKAH